MITPTARRAAFGAFVVGSVSAALAFAAQRPDSSVRFVNAAAESGINFKHENGASPEKHLPETMGAGVIVLDFDNDGSPDLLFVNGGSLVDKTVAERAAHRLYRNKGDGTFADVTASAGIATSGYSMGACTADYDNDGWADIYITGFASNHLYRNTGKNSFVDVTEKTGVAGGQWSTSCSFADIDNDGFADLYVARYVDFRVSNNRFCSTIAGVRGYCHPNLFASVPDLFFRNKGDGTFSDVSKSSGIADAAGGNGLGVVFGDIDDDGRVDLFVANDSTPNFLFHNKGGGQFADIAFRAGVAFGRDGMAMAGMGTDMGDIDGSGRLSIIVTNLERQAHSLFRNVGKTQFVDATFSSGIGEVTLPFVGFGALFFDYDNDTDLDLSIVNGDVMDNVAVFRDARTYEQLRLLLENDGSGKFKSVGPASGPGFAVKRAGRALASADLDNDGDLDLIVANVGQAAEILRNEGGNRANALLVKAVGVKSNHDGLGARLKLTVGDKVLRRDLKAASSYLAQSDLRVHFGLGGAANAERLEILWPSGAMDVIENIAANQILTVKEGGGTTEKRPFRKK